MDRLLSIAVAIVALALMARWGVRSSRLRREHGPPPQGAVRRIFLGVTAGYVAAGGMLVWWLLGDLIRPGWLQLLLAMVASVSAYRAGVALESLRSASQRGQREMAGERVDPGPADR